MSLIKKIAAVVLVFMTGGCLFAATAFASYGSGLNRYPQTIPKENFTTLAEKAIEEQLAKNGENRRHEFVLARMPMPMRCPAGKIELKVSLPREIRYGGITPVYVNVMVDGALFRRMVCYYKVKMFDTVFIAMHDLMLERRLENVDFRREEKEIFSRTEEYLKDEKDIVGKVPSRVIREGTAITKNMVQNPLIIEAGSPVTLVSERGGIIITAPGVALMRGREGSVIRVRNDKSRKMMRGRIIDANTVKVF